MEYEVRTKPRKTKSRKLSSAIPYKDKIFRIRLIYALDNGMLLVFPFFNYVVYPRPFLLSSTYELSDKEREGPLLDESS